MHSLFQVIILIFISFAFAEAKSPDYWKIQGVIFKDVLWIHPKPTYYSKVIGKIPYNATCIKNLKCTEDLSWAKYRKLSQKEKIQLKYRTKWCKIVYRGIVGWVNGNYLGENKNYFKKSRKCSQKRLRH